MDRLLQAAREGRSGTLLLVGEAGIGQIYRKLDVRGRAQLARLMAMELPEGERDPEVLADALSCGQQAPYSVQSPARARSGRPAGAGAGGSPA